MKLQNYVLDQWMEGDGDGHLLLDASNGREIASVSSAGLDFEAMFRFARQKGNPGLRSMTFHERANMLRALARHLSSKKDRLYELSFATGATRADSILDIDGGINTLMAYAALGKQLPNESYCVDGEAIRSKGSSLIGHHILVPKEGVAVHINAFCFPVWSLLRKVAVSLLAGMPAIVKPAQLTSFLAEAAAKELITSGILPVGALQLICGPAHGLLDHVQGQDVVSFTGSSRTGHYLKSRPAMLREGVPFLMGAPSLNACVLGADAVPGSEEFDLFVAELYRDMTTKSGQRCTATRRAIIPRPYLEDVLIALGRMLQQTVIGDPRAEGVTMGPLAGRSQLEEVRQQVRQLSGKTPVVFGDPDYVHTGGGDMEKGAFFAPVLMISDNPLESPDIHETEVYGPVCTLMPYDDLEEAIAITKMGRGSVCSTMVTRDEKLSRQYALGAATHHGRVQVLSRETIREDTGHAALLPLLVHGGPGRAGGSEEMGGMRGLLPYMQRTAILGSPDAITGITNIYQHHSRQTEKEVHVFRKHFEEMEIGDTVTTRKRTITEADISGFANLSWDHFYAHTDVTSLEGSTFTGIVAHGYLVLSAAAGLFVEAGRGPVLLNYGLEDCRFTKPVYPGTTIGVKLTVKEKIEQERKGADDIAKGIVKFLVDVYDEKGDTVAIATILTLVKKRDQGVSV